MHAHPVRFLLPYVPVAIAASTCTRRSPPFPFVVLCALVGGKCAPDAHWRRVWLWPPVRPRLCVGPGRFPCFFRCGMAPARAWGYLHHLGMAAYGHVKALRRKGALEIHRSNVCLEGYPAELINADSTSHKSKTIIGWEKRSVAWGVGV